MSGSWDDTIRLWDISGLAAGKFFMQPTIAAASYLRTCRACSSLCLRLCWAWHTGTGGGRNSARQVADVSAWQVADMSHV